MRSIRFCRDDDNEIRHMAELATGVKIYYDCWVSPRGMPWLQLTNRRGKVMPLKRQAMLLEAYPALLADIEARQAKCRAKWS